MLLVTGDSDAQPCWLQRHGVRRLPASPAPAHWAPFRLFPMAPAFVGCRCHAPQRRTRVAAKKGARTTLTLPAASTAACNIFFWSNSSIQQTGQANKRLFLGTTCFACRTCGRLCLLNAAAPASRNSASLSAGLFPPKLCCLHFRDRSALHAP